MSAALCHASIMTYYDHAVLIAYRLNPWDQGIVEKHPDQFATPKRVNKFSLAQRMIARYRAPIVAPKKEGDT
jgi:hypothetical protein